MKLSNIPLRLASGAFILNSGIEKLSLDEEGAEGMQRMAAQGIPELGDLSPEAFKKFVSYGEIAVGAALLFPAVPARVAGLGLAAFSGGLLAMYFRTPGMTQEDDIRPTEDGTPIAKDVWLAAIAAALIIGGGKKKRKK